MTATETASASSSSASGPKGSAAAKKGPATAAYVSKRHKGKRAEDQGIERNVTIPALRRIARRSGVKMIRKNSYARARATCDQFNRRVIKDAIVLTDVAGLSTITSEAVIVSLRRNNMRIFGAAK